MIFVLVVQLTDWWISPWFAVNYRWFIKFWCIFVIFFHPCSQMIGHWKSTYITLWINWIATSFMQKWNNSDGIWHNWIGLLTNVYVKKCKLPKQRKITQKVSVRHRCEVRQRTSCFQMWFEKIPKDGDTCTRIPDTYTRTHTRTHTSMDLEETCVSLSISLVYWPLRKSLTDNKNVFHPIFRIWMNEWVLSVGRSVQCFFFFLSLLSECASMVLVSSILSLFHYLTVIVSCELRIWMQSQQTVLHCTHIINNEAKQEIGKYLIHYFFSLSLSSLHINAFFCCCFI